MGQTDDGGCSTLEISLREAFGPLEPDGENSPGVGLLHALLVVEPGTDVEKEREQVIDTTYVPQNKSTRSAEEERRWNGLIKNRGGGEGGWAGGGGRGARGDGAPVYLSTCGFSFPFRAWRSSLFRK